MAIWSFGAFWDSWQVRSQVSRLFELLAIISTLEVFELSQNTHYLICPFIISNARQFSLSQNIHYLICPFIISNVQFHYLKPLSQNIHYLKLLSQMFHYLKPLSQTVLIISNLFIISNKPISQISENFAQAVFVFSSVFAGVLSQGVAQGEQIHPLGAKTERQ